MRTILFYRPNSDHERMVLDYLRDFKMQTGKDLPSMDVDKPEAIELCRLYEIMEYPAILVTDDDGHMQNLWKGTILPRIGEVSYYVPAGVMRQGTGSIKQGEGDAGSTHKSVIRPR